MFRTLFCSGLACALLTPIAPAEACFNEVNRRIDRRVQLLVRAEGALRRGQLQGAARLTLRVYPGIRRTLALTSRAPGLLRRALRVAAIGTVRSDGRLALGRQWRGRTAAQRASNLRWATAALRQLDALRPNAPALQGALGEALSKIGESKEALALLSKLAAKDLITSPHGYAALARLYAAAGDTTRSAAAVARCKAMSRGSDTVQCDVPKSPRVALLWR